MSLAERCSHKLALYYTLWWQTKSEVYVLISLCIIMIYCYSTYVGTLLCANGLNAKPVSNPVAYWNISMMVLHTHVAITNNCHGIVTLAYCH